MPLPGLPGRGRSQGFRLSGAFATAASISAMRTWPWSSQSVRACRTRQTMSRTAWTSSVVFIWRVG
jgi:hypothetical protein